MLPLCKQSSVLQASIQSLLPRLHYFDDGICIVHHMFGAQTTDLVRQAYGDALLSAHFEVGLFYKAQLLCLVAAISTVAWG